MDYDIHASFGLCSSVFEMPCQLIAGRRLHISDPRKGYDAKRQGMGGAGFGRASRLDYEGRGVGIARLALHRQSYRRAWVSAWRHRSGAFRLTGNQHGRGRSADTVMV